MPRHALNVATRVPDRTAAAAAVMEWELQTAREAKPLTPPLAVKARQQQQQQEEEEEVVVVVVEVVLLTQQQARVEEDRARQQALAEELPPARRQALVGRLRQQAFRPLRLQARVEARRKALEELLPPARWVDPRLPQRLALLRLRRRLEPPRVPRPSLRRLRERDRMLPPLTYVLFARA